MDTDEPSRDPENDKVRRQQLGRLVFIGCVLLAVPLGVVLGCIPGLLIILDAQNGPPVPHGGMYAALGAWLVCIPLGAILGLLTGLFFGLVFGLSIARKRLEG
jgi:hypothetical protein